MSGLFRSINPKNNKLLKEFACISNQQLETKVERSYQSYRKEFDAGTVEGMQSRFKKLAALKDILNDRKDMLCETVTNEMGKPLAQAHGEIGRALEQLEWCQANAEQHLVDQDLQLRSGQRCEAVFQPLGPTLVIMPWNFPIWLPFKTCIPPMVLGNSIMLKHAEATPMTSVILEDMFVDAGFDNGEYQNMFITHDQAESVLSDYRVRALKFTGSTAAGKNLGMLCGKYMKKAAFELGGNDPFVVLKEADLELAVNMGYASRMANNGQACINAKRFIIEDSVYDEFKDRLVNKIQTATVIGDPLDPATNLGPIAMERQKTKLISQIKAAVANDGATIALGSTDFNVSDSNLSGGNYVEPMILENIKVDSPSWSEEFFGPTFNLWRGSSEEHCLELANNSEYGLSAAVFTENEERLRYAARNMRNGAVFCNAVSTTAPDFPSGGIKGSGYGRECYSDGLHDIANRKSIVTRPTPK